MHVSLAEERWESIKGDVEALCGGSRFSSQVKERTLQRLSAGARKAKTWVEVATHRYHSKVTAPVKG